MINHRKSSNPLGKACISRARTPPRLVLLVQLIERWSKSVWEEQGNAGGPRTIQNLVNGDQEGLELLDLATRCRVDQDVPGGHSQTSTYENITGVKRYVAACVMITCAIQWSEMTRKEVKASHGVEEWVQDHYRNEHSRPPHRPTSVEQRCFAGHE